MEVKEAVYWLNNLIGDYSDYYDDALEMGIKALEQQEIIWCKDCKHKGTKNCVANVWTKIFGATVKDYFYCGLAERGTDEHRNNG